MSGIKPILMITAAVLGLLLIWTQLSPKTKDPDSSAIEQPGQLISAQTDNTLLARIESLEAELASAQSIRQQHENRLNQLEQQLSIISAATLSESVNEHEIASKASQQPRNKLPTLQEKLLAASIPLDTIQRIQQRVGENRLARLQLRNQAIREEWIDSPEYIEKVQQLPSPTGGLREEFGDQIYDQYLYDSGRPNRIIVSEVFAGSAAQNAGIEPGDIILSYASDLIFSMSELQQATTEGIAGEPVLIEILRDDLPFSTSAPRGPLGISMTMIRKQPE